MHDAFPSLEARDVLQGSGGDPTDRLLGEEGLVRGDEHVRERQQSGEDVVPDDFLREVLEEEVSLLLVDVDAKGTKASVLQGVDHGSGVDESTPARVDEHGSLFHSFEGAPIDQMEGFGGQWGVDVDVVDACRPQRNDLSTARGQGGEDLPVHHVVDEHTDRREPLSKSGCLRRKPWLEERDLVAVTGIGPADEVPSYDFVLKTAIRTTPRAYRVQPGKPVWSSLAMRT